jgi:uncharacterized phage protein (TIGR02220 family)
MARSWCKVSTSLDSHPRIRAAGNLGRQVFEFVLRRNGEVDRNGVIPALHLDPTYLADILMMTAEQAADGVSRCVRTGLLSRDTENFVVNGWDDEWGKRPMTEAERKRNQRARSRYDSMSRKCPDTDVTESDRPDSHTGEERRSEEKRGEEKQPPLPPSGGSACADGSSAELRLVPASETPKKLRRKPSDPTPEESASVQAVLGKLGAVAGVAYRGSKEHVRLIVDRLRDGVTEMELRAVIAFCDEAWEKKPDMRVYLRPETLFGPQTIEKYLDHARTRYAKQLAEAQRQPEQRKAAT